jgi:imidazolonepropionase-like amidohydrolase
MFSSASGHNATRENILRQLKQYAAYGVTTVTSLGLNLPIFYELQPQLHSGELPGADLYGADKGFGAVGGGPPAAMGILDEQVYRPTTPEEARAEVRQTAERHPSFVKLWLDDFHGKYPARMRPEIYAAIIDEAHRQGLRVAAHVYYLEDAKRLVADRVDVLAHGVRDGPIDAAFVATLRERQVWYIPTLGLDEASYLFAVRPELLSQPLLQHSLQPALADLLTDPHWRAGVLADREALTTAQQALANNLHNVKILYDAHVRIGFGTDSGATPFRIAGFAEHRELHLLVEAGLTPLEAIETATKNAAALLGLEDRGTLATGKLADLVIVAGNPATDIDAVDRIDAVWQRGRRLPDTPQSLTP